LVDLDGIRLIVETRCPKTASNRVPRGVVSKDDIAWRKTMTTYTTVNSPLGALLLVGDESAGRTALRSVSFAGTGAVDPEWRRDPAAFADAARQLEEYFAGERTGFDVDRAPSGTPFQRLVWAAVDAVPYGTTVSYGEISRRVGAAPDRIRAVAAAIGANPLLIVRPCHRVVGADGALTGYAGGVSRKRDLLTHEGALQPTLI
jgi:methylated-DNA-[protein]-cysteine S-methyltransferase